MWVMNGMGCGSWTGLRYCTQVYSINLITFRIKLGNFMDEKIG